MPHIREHHIVAIGLLLSDIGVIDRDNARVCGVTIRTIRRWRRLYQRRGLPRGGPSVARCPRCTNRPLDGRAYTFLLGVYLGDGHIVRTARGCFVLALFQDAKYAESILEWCEAVRTVKGGKVATRRMPGCVVVQSYWKHWPCLFPQHGAGRKHLRRIVLEPWQEDLVRAHPEAFLRGLFHSDGCRITNWTCRTVAGRPKRYEYPRYFFNNRSPDIIDLCAWALDLLGVVYRRPKPDAVSVARREAVATLDGFVGPKR